MSGLSLDRFHFDTTPEGNPARDAFCSWTGVGVVPGGVSVDLVTDNDVVVAGHHLPVAGRVAVAGANVLLAHVSKREVLIAFDNDCVRAFRQNSVVPGCSIALGYGFFGRLWGYSTYECHAPNIRQRPDAQCDAAHISR